MRAKYVMFDWGNSNVPILFPAHIGHDEIIKMVQSVYSGVTPMSAGFISHNHEVYGESHSTELKSKPEDSFWIKLMFKEN